MRSYIFLALAIFSFAANAQNTSELLIKYHENVSYRPTLRYDHFLTSGSYFYIENSNYINKNLPVGSVFPFSKISQLDILAGYEHKANDHWYIGLCQRAVLLSGGNIFTSKLNVSHRGKIAGLHFIKEGAFEYYKYPRIDNPAIIHMNYGSASLNFSLLKDFKIFERKLFIGFSYRPYLFFDLLNDGYSSYSKRRIDKTLLKIELDYALSKSFLLSLFYIKQTNYSYQLASFGSVNTPEARTNTIFPVVGVALNFIYKMPKDFIPMAPLNKDFVY